MDRFNICEVENINHKYQKYIRDGKDDRVARVKIELETRR